jgi:LPS export ABC transporter protein LptC
MRAPKCSRRRLTVLLVGCACAALGADPSPQGFQSELHATGMTFVGSRGSINELVVRAERADFDPASDLAKLETVHVTALDQDEGRSFEMRCARGELNVETNDFLASGDVRGTTGDGQRYTTAWVRYDHARAELYTDAPVAMEDATGSFRGDGFRYDARNKSFRLLGNVSVVQKP